VKRGSGRSIASGSGPLAPRQLGAAQGPVADESDREGGQLGPAPAQRPLRILIADDNAALRTLLHTLLALEPDFEVVGEAEDGRRALELVEQSSPDLLLLDIAMPELDGLEVLEQLRERERRPRVLVYTGFASPEVERSARELGAVDVVVKGLDPTLLIDRLRAAAALGA
jgi:DNA-binding NarL/FixJ family response regulator